jgi:hypothetical protein
MSRAARKDMAGGTAGGGDEGVSSEAIVSLVLAEFRELQTENLGKVEDDERA